MSGVLVGCISRVGCRGFQAADESLRLRALGLLRASSRAPPDSRIGLSDEVSADDAHWSLMGQHEVAKIVIRDSALNVESRFGSRGDNVSNSSLDCH